MYTGTISSTLERRIHTTDRQSYFECNITRRVLSECVPRTIEVPVCVLIAYTEMADTLRRDLSLSL
jgi:hypothetical protein